MTPRSERAMGMVLQAQAGGPSDPNWFLTFAVLDLDAKHSGI